MRTQAEWKVDTHIAFTTGPTSSRRRSCISLAALLVKVMARIEVGWTPLSLTRWAIRWVSTRVLPEPAPATIRVGPSVARTATRWASFSPSSRSGEASPVSGSGIRSTAASIRAGLTAAAGNRAPPAAVQASTNRRPGRRAMLRRGGPVRLARPATLAADHGGVEHYLTSFTYVGGGARFGSILPLPAVPTEVRKGGGWTLQRLARGTPPPPLVA